MVGQPAQAWTRRFKDLNINFLSVRKITVYNKRNQIEYVFVIFCDLLSIKVFLCFQSNTHMVTRKFISINKMNKTNTVKQNKHTIYLLGSFIRFSISVKSSWTKRLTYCFWFMVLKASSINMWTKKKKKKCKHILKAVIDKIAQLHFFVYTNKIDAFR